MEKKNNFTMDYISKKTIASPFTNKNYDLYEIEKEYIIFVDPNKENKIITGWCGSLNDSDNIDCIISYERKKLKDYYRSDEAYYSFKTKRVYTAYHFSDCKYVIMRENNSINPSVINWFAWEPGDNISLYDCLKKYVDIFESMEYIDKN